ncbi:MAG: twin-arginine translocase subunit TatC [Muribaculaceae bacterium]|nr:twin-arginine translocase subunit TatC [Muribaculaceae bacterium]
MKDEELEEEYDQEDDSSQGLLTFGGHLEVLRRMLFRILAIVLILAIIIFCFKKETFTILLAPHKSDFCTFNWIEGVIQRLGFDFHFTEYNIPLINTELSAQFMTHITVSCILAFLLASPYILFELFRYISPALYESEKKYSYLVAGIIYLLFVMGLTMSYFVLFPISFQFLATYQVDEEIVNTITLDSYISTFTTLTFLMGIVFQLPVIAFVLAKMGFINYCVLKRYRHYAFIVIMVIAAIITPPDIFTLILVTIPIYGLYEISIFILKRIDRKKLA